MDVTVLGAHNTESRDTRCTSLLVDDFLAIDAGGLTSSLSFAAQEKITTLLLTHQHYDHTRDVPCLAMNAYLRGKTIDVLCTGAVYDVLSRHLLSGELYPDFRQTPPDRPTLRFTILEPLRETDVAGYTILPVPVNHSVPAVGFQVTSPQGKKIFYTSDTGPGLSDCWRAISPDVLFIEVTASDRYEEFAQQSRHLTPRLLKAELADFGSFHDFVPRVVLVHVNPTEERLIASEIESVSRDTGASISLASEGLCIRL